MRAWFRSRSTQVGHQRQLLVQGDQFRQGSHSAGLLDAVVLEGSQDSRQDELKIDAVRPHGPLRGESDPLMHCPDSQTVSKYAAPYSPSVILGRIDCRSSTTRVSYKTASSPIERRTDRLRARSHRSASRSDAEYSCVASVRTKFLLHSSTHLFEQGGFVVIDKWSTFLVRRFDRTADDERIHFASAMTLLGTIS